MRQRQPNRETVSIHLFSKNFSLTKIVKLFVRSL